MALTAKQQLFAEEYLKRLNATDAARAAGYSEKYLHTNASKLLQNTTIAAEIERLRPPATMGKDEVLTRLTEQARGEHSIFIDDYGSVNIAAMKAAGKLHLVKSIKQTVAGRNIEFYDSQAALDKLARHHGLYNDRVKVVTWQDEVVELLRKGDLLAADVLAAYPDLAAEFFARAGIALPTVDNDRND